MTWILIWIQVMTRQMQIGHRKRFLELQVRDGVENKHSNEHFLNISFEGLNEIKRVLKELNTILNKQPVMLNKPIGYKL